MDATNKLFEAILDAPNGKRMLSRVARTCRALCEPALNVLWRDLDTLIPILWQFPGHLLKKARKPGMGFVKTPTEKDWEPVLKHSKRVRQITYNEHANNIAPSIFAALEESRPRSQIFPQLIELNWKVETPAGLARSSMFLSPQLRAVNLEVGTMLPQLDAFLADLTSRTRLTSFSFISPTNLPDSFTELLGRQHSLEKLVLMAPGALAPGVGRWAASLSELKTLRLDLTGRSMIAVEGFFDELRPRSGDSTPSSVGSIDSGVFSEEEVDFSLIRKSALRLTGDLRSKGSFSQVRKLHLTGDVSNIAVFLKHIATPLIQLELVIEDPPDRADWHDLSALICEKLGDSLQSLRVTATNSSRFKDLVRSTPRAEPASGRLSFLGGGEAEWVKVRVGGRKINEEFLKAKDNEDLKLKFYDLMIQHALHQNNYLDVAKFYLKVWETPSIKDDTEDKGRAALEHIVYYVILAPHDNEQSDIMHHLFVNPALSKLDLHYNLVKCFTTHELMRWPGIEAIYGEFLKKTPVFSSEKRWEDLHTRVIEHNIRVVAEYYTRITLTRLTSLLDLTAKQTEDTLARLVVSGTIWARIDRPAGIVSFRNKRSAEDVMNDWSSDMQKLLGLVEKTWMGMNAAQAAQSRVAKASS
ncbi:hypothetical protein C0992_013127 [Termitomyces sp. T32_za158]|nr:hypothetical protein C0992_013127 [Termitomyces sp. T32_za158]